MKVNITWLRARPVWQLVWVSGTVKSIGGFVISSRISGNNSCEVFMQVDCEMITFLALTLRRCCHHFVLFIREK